MECARFIMAFFNGRKRFSRLDLDGGYTGNIYPLCVSLYIQLLENIAAYWRHVNTTIPNNIKYNC